MKKNNWYVLTGAPSSGKTTLLKALKKRGNEVSFEQARFYIDQQLALGKTLEEIRADEFEFQKEVLNLKENLEKNLKAEETIFIERGIPDTTAYLKWKKLKIDSKLEKRLKKSNYKKVFLIELLNFHPDYARTETEEDAHMIESLLEKAYQEVGAEIVKVPKMSIEERIRFILNNL